MSEVLLSNVSTIILVVAAICTLVSVITEFTKDIGFLNNIPTTLQVLVLSIVISVVAFFAYISYANIAFAWYHLVAVIFAGFIIAIICAKGWDYLIDIWKRFFREKLF